MAVAEPGRRPEFYRALLDSNIWVLVDPATQGRSVPAGSEIKLITWERHDGVLVLPFFTSPARILGVKQGDLGAEMIARDLFESMPDSYMHLNPGGQYGLDKKLTLIFAYTAAADRNASSRTDGENIGIPVLIAGTQDNLAAALSGAGVDVSVMAVDAVPVAYKEPTSGTQQGILDAELASLTSDANGVFAGFKKARKDLKADIGILIVNNDDPYTCGKAQLKADAAHAFAVVNWRCMGARLAAEHEIGHVLGLFHDDDNNAVPNYARGFVYSPENYAHPFTTIMGQPDHCQTKGHYCYRTRKYSNPFDTNNLTGAEKVVIGTPGKFDSACVLRRTVPLAVNFADQL